MKRKIRWTYMFNQKIAPANFMICRAIVVYEKNNFSFVLGIDKEGKEIGECAEIANKYLFKSRKDCLKAVLRLFRTISEVAMLQDDLFDTEKLSESEIYYYDGFSAGQWNMSQLSSTKKLQEIKKKLKAK